MVTDYGLNIIILSVTSQIFTEYLLHVFKKLKKKLILF